MNSSSVPEQSSILYKEIFNTRKWTATGASQEGVCPLASFPGHAVWLGRLRIRLRILRFDLIFFFLHVAFV
jgi:hypothetical protein